MTHIVFVHYLDVKVNKTNVGGKTCTGEATSDSQKSSSLSSGFPRNYGSMPSGSTDSMSPTSTLTSLCEDADLEDFHQASSGLHSHYKSQNLGNDLQMDKIDAHSNSSYLMHSFSGDHEQLPIFRTEYIPLVPWDKSRDSDTTYPDGQREHGIASWDNAMEQSAGKHSDPSLVSSTSISSSTLGNILEEDHTVPGNLLWHKNTHTEEERRFKSVQSNWQIPTEDKWSFIQSLSLEFGSDYGVSLPGDVTNNASPEISHELLDFSGEPKEQAMQQTYQSSIHMHCLNLHLCPILIMRFQMIPH